METPAVDSLDHAILAILRTDARISWRDLGDAVGLGATATADRVRRLRESGVIQRFTTVVDPAALGIGLRAIVEIRLHPDIDPDQFEHRIANSDAVQSAFHVTGSFDFQLVVACADVSTLDGLLRGWKADGWVLESNTRLMLSQIDLEAARERGSADPEA